MAGVVEGLRELARDLVNIEVNTILSDNMSAQKMPGAPHALLDIAGEYIDKLCELGIDVTAFWDVAPEATRGERELDETKVQELIAGLRGKSVDLASGRTAFDRDRMTNGWVTFERLRWVAANALRDEAGTEALGRSDRVVLARICRNCDQLKAMVQELGRRDGSDWNKLLGRTRRQLIEPELRHLRPPALDLEDAVRLRKIWEVSTDDVVYQTTIQLDGDVVTRLRRELDGEDGVAERAFQAHGKSIEVSLSHWRLLFGVIADLAGVALSALFPRAPTGPSSGPPEP